MAKLAAVVFVCLAVLCGCEKNDFVFIQEIQRKCLEYSFIQCVMVSRVII